jgi:hypothetical protein
MAVVWVKKTDTYRFTIVGDCGCNKVHCWPGQSSRTVRLAKWSVTGEGKITPKISIVKGKPVVSFTIGAPRIVVNANCCGTPDAENKGYWMEPPKRDTSTSVPTTPQRPVTPRNPGSSSTAKTPKPSQPTPKQPESPRNPRMIPVDIPKLPTGSVCRHDLDALYESLVKARETANANAIKAAKAKTLLQLAFDAGEPGVTQAMIDAAEQLKKTWFRKEAAIRKLLQEAGSLKIEENCKKQNPGHSSVPQTPQEETSSAAVPVDDDETEEEESTHTISETPHTVVAIPLPIARPVIAISEHHERGARRRIETTARHVVARGERLRRNHRLHRGEGFHRYSVERRLHRLARGFLHRSFRGRGWMGGRMRHGFRGMRHREFGMRSRGFRMRGMGMRSVGMRGMRLR